MLRSLAGTCQTAVVLALLGSVGGCSAASTDSGATGGLASKVATGGVGMGGSGTGGFATGGSDNLGGSNPTGGNPPTGGIAATGGVEVGATGAGGLTGGGGTTGGAMPTGGLAATGGSGAATGGQGGDSTFTLSGLTIEENPNSVLSAYVNWTTDQPADSVVQFGEGEIQWEISDPELVTTHHVLIIGMHADSTVQIQARSSAGGQTVSATTSHTTGSLPPSIPVGQVPINDTTRTSPGWTLMNVQKGDGNSVPSSDYPAQAVMYDSGGQPVWYQLDGTGLDFGGAISVDLTDRGVLFGPVGGQNMTVVEPPREVDFAGNVIWECSDPGCGNSEGNLSHHAAKLANGNYVLVRWLTDGGNQEPVIEEITEDQNLVASWDFQQFVPRPADATGDWCHGNAATIDAANNAVYISCRWMGLIKVTYEAPTLLWHLPASYNAAGLGTLQFVPSDSQFTDIHDPEIHDDGTILFFDNGGWDGLMQTTEHHSRAVEYQIDEDAGTATLVWEFPGNFDVDSWYRDDWYQPFWGDADRLANGNVLVTAGERGSDTESRVFEVTKEDGQVVWELHLGPDIGVYRAERITPPLVRAITP